VKLRDLALGLLVVAIVGGTPPQAVGGGTDSGSVLAELPKLERRISCTATKIPLAELVAKVAADTGVPLSAADAVAEEPVAVAVNKIPARELLERLAGLLDLRWSRLPTREGTLEIGQDTAAREREDALRRSASADGERRFREEVQRYVEAAALTPEQIRATVQEVQRRRKQLAKMTPAQRGALFQSPQEWERIRRAAIVQRMTSPLTRALASLLGRLTPTQWTVLRSEGALDFCTEPRTGEYPLPDDLSGAFRSNPPKRDSTLPSPAPRRIGSTAGTAGQRLPSPEQAPRDTWTSATGFRVIVRMDSGRLACSGGMALLLRVAPIVAPESVRGTSADANRTSSLLVEVDALGGRPGAEQKPSAGSAATAEGPALPKRFQTRLRPRIDPTEPGSAPVWRFTDLMPDVARTFGVQIVADAYWCSAVTLDGRPLPSEPVTLAGLVQEFAGAGHTWACDGKWLSLRSRTWYFDRQREIPLRITREWQSTVRSQGALSLDACSRLAGTLSTAQFRTLGAVVEQLDLPQDLLALPAARAILQLYATLAPSQRQALWAGKSLAVAEMTPRQRDLWMETLRDRSRRPGALPILTEHPWTGGSLALRSSPYVRVAERWNDLTIYRAELPGDSAGTPPPPTSSPGRNPRTQPAADDSPPPRAPDEAAARRPRPQSVTRHSVSQVVFTLRTGDDRRVVVALTTSPP
jgi:hypothetical protein